MLLRFCEFGIKSLRQPTNPNVRLEMLCTVLKSVRFVFLCIARDLLKSRSWEGLYSAGLVVPSLLIPPRHGSQSIQLGFYEKFFLLSFWFSGIFFWRFNSLHFIRTRLNLYRLFVTSFLRHPICPSQFSLSSWRLSANAGTLKEEPEQRSSLVV